MNEGKLVEAEQGQLCGGRYYKGEQRNECAGADRLVIVEEVEILVTNSSVCVEWVSHTVKHFSDASRVCDNSAQF